jgi:hypothetical protein
MTIPLIPDIHATTRNSILLTITSQQVPLPASPRPCKAVPAGTNKKHRSTDQKGRNGQLAKWNYFDLTEIVQKQMNLK